MRRANLSKHLHGLFVFACVICLFAVFPLLTNGAAASVGVWTATGSLNVARSYHTATLLNNDEVLVVGGEDASGTALNSCELYDPSKGTWTETGSLLTARQYHTATLLQNGQVLVTGGVDATGTPLNSCELYDPSQGTWAATENFGLERSFHTATLLPSGLVLVAGGLDNFNVATNFSTLYDPSTGKWTGTTGNLITARASHTANLLDNGDVLVGGGLNANQISLASCEIYNATAGTWTATANLPTAHSSHAAALLANGNVLVAGGLDYTAGDKPPVVDKAAEFESQAEAWLDEKSMNLRRLFFGLLLWAVPSPGGTGTVRQGQSVSPGSLVLAVGGESDTDVLSSCEIFDSSTNKWTFTGRLADARYAHTTTLLNSGQVLAAGGGTAIGTVLATCELFTPPATAPGAPTNVKATVTGVRQVTVSFTAASTNGGSQITGYTVKSNPSGGTDETPGSTSLSHTVDNLANGTGYTFKVTAINAKGLSTSSKASNKITTWTNPGKPAITSLTAGDAEVTVKFSAPKSDGGTAITGYTVTSNSGGADETPGSTSLSHTVDSLTNGDPYKFTVTAANAVGTSTSLLSKAITPATTPGAPTIVSAEPGKSKGTVVVTFDPPTSDGGSNITRYTVICPSPPNNKVKATGKPTLTSITVTDLKSGTNYTFEVYATNAMGNGTPSSAFGPVVAP